MVAGRVARAGGARAAGLAAAGAGRGSRGGGRVAQLHARVHERRAAQAAQSRRFPPPAPIFPPSNLCSAFPAVSPPPSPGRPRVAPFLFISPRARVAVAAEKSYSFDAVVLLMMSWVDSRAPLVWRAIRGVRDARLAEQQHRVAECARQSDRLVGNMGADAGGGPNGAAGDQAQGSQGAPGALGKGIPRGGNAAGAPSADGSSPASGAAPGAAAAANASGSSSSATNSSSPSNSTTATSTTPARVSRILAVAPAPASAPARAPGAGAAAGAANGTAGAGNGSRPPLNGSGQPVNSSGPGQGRAWDHAPGGGPHDLNASAVAELCESAVTKPVAPPCSKRCAPGSELCCDAVWLPSFHVPNVNAYSPTRFSSSRLSPVPPSWAARSACRVSEMR
ncbi:unnamed protein product [Closterium sp. Naga37s-1]|nr:unnamed protein product [Closterium sp. Naga37s-1]